MDTYPIGHKVWHNGDECEVIGQPYMLYGGEWQDAIKNGKKVSLVTPRQAAKNLKAKQDEYATQQAQFRKLRAI